MEKKLLEELRCLLRSLGCAFCLPTAKHLEACRILLEFIESEIGKGDYYPVRLPTALCPRCGGYSFKIFKDKVDNDHQCCRCQEIFIPKKRNWVCPKCGDGYVVDWVFSSFTCSCGYECFEQKEKIKPLDFCNGTCIKVPEVLDIAKKVNEIIFKTNARIEREK
jgi:hypothetical protein